MSCHFSSTQHHKNNFKAFDSISRMKLSKTNRSQIITYFTTISPLQWMRLRRHHKLLAVWIYIETCVLEGLVSVARRVASGGQGNKLLKIKIKVKNTTDIWQEDARPLGWGCPFIFRHAGWPVRSPGHPSSLSISLSLCLAARLDHYFALIVPLAFPAYLCHLHWVPSHVSSPHRTFIAFSHTFHASAALLGLNAELERVVEGCRGRGVVVDSGRASSFIWALLLLMSLINYSSQIWPQNRIVAESSSEKGSSVYLLEAGWEQLCSGYFRVRLGVWCFSHRVLLLPSCKLSLQSELASDIAHWASPSSSSSSHWTSSARVSYMWVLPVRSSSLGLGLDCVSRFFM